MIQKKKGQKLVLLKLESVVVVWWVILVSMLLTLILLGCRIRSVKWRKCCPNLGCLCTAAKQKYGDRVMEKERVALFLCQANGEHRRLVPQKLSPPSLNRERLGSQTGVSGNYQGRNSLHSFRFQNGGGADRIRVVS